MRVRASRILYEFCSNAEQYVAMDMPSEKPKTAPVGETVASLVVGRLCELAGATATAPLAFFGVPGDFR